MILFKIHICFTGYTKLLGKVDQIADDSINVLVYTIDQTMHNLDVVIV
jgi:hypothetical protein